MAIEKIRASRVNTISSDQYAGNVGLIWYDPTLGDLRIYANGEPGGMLITGGGNGSPGGANGQVQFNQNGVFGGSANLTFDKTTGALTAVSFAGDGSALANIAGANVVGEVTNATYASSAVSAITAETVTANSQPNITSVGILTELSVAGNVTGDYFIGNGSQLTGINGGASNTIFNGNSNVAIDTPSGNITITANASQPYTWTFDTTGELSLAGNIVSSSNLVFKTDNDNSWMSQAVGANGFSQLYWTSNIAAADPYDGNDDFAWAYVDSGGFHVTSRTVEPAKSYTWEFRGSDGAVISPGKFITPPGDTSAIFNFNAPGAGGSSSLEFGADSPGSQYFYASARDPVGRSAEFVLEAIDEGNLNALIRTSSGLGPSMQWNFTANGELILPGDTAYISSDASRVSIYSDITTETAGITVTSGSSTNIFNEGVVNIETNSADVLRQWQFDQTGDLTIPGSIILPDSGSITTSSYNNPGVLTANADSNWAYGFSGDGGAEYYTQVKFFGDHSTTRGFKILDVDSGNVWLFNGNGGLTAPGIIETTGSISATGNIDTSGYFVGNGVYLSSLTASNVIGNVANATYATTAESAITAGTVTTAAQPNITSVGTLTSVTSTGNVTGGNINTGAQVVATGNISGGNLRTTGSITATGNITGGNIGAGGPPNYYNLSGYTSAITVVAPTTGSAIIETVGSAGNAGTIAFGNVNFRQAAISSTVTNDLSFFVNFSGVSNSVAQSMVLYSNLNARFSNAVTAVSNITGGNLLTSGLISATGNITSTANVTGGNLTTAGLISATGNITGGNLITAGQVIAGNGSITQPGFRFAGDTDSGLYLTGDGNIAVVTNAGIRVLINDSGANITGSMNLTSALSATGNVTAGNINTAGQVVATGNITGGNIGTAGQVSATGTITSAGGTNATAFAVGNSAVSNVALGMFPTAGTPGEYAIRDHSTVATNLYFDAGVGGSANSVFNFRTSNAYTTLATINSYGITLTTNRPAFRVTGSGTTNNLTTTQNGTGALNGNNWAADYTQGSGLNSTTGVFTAPAAGLYQINVVGRNSGYSSGISQLAVVKNATGGTGAGGTVACMIEWAASSSMNHVGSGTVARLAVNDTLALKVLAGQINFDSNDNWSVAYLG